MILSDREIQAALARNAFYIDPIPPAKAWSSTAIDLRLDNELRRWVAISNGGVEAAISPGSANFNYSQLAARHTEIIDLTQPPRYFDLDPKKLILGWTIEKIKLPHRSRIAGRVEGKSSLARLGLGVHVTAPTIHAGFGWDSGDPESIGNPIQLEIWNIGEFTIRLVPGLPICQLIFEEVHGTPDKGYQGMFQQQGPGVR